MDAGVGRALLAAFGAVHVINLPERADRRREMTAELAGIGLGAGDVEWFAAERPPDAGRFPSRGARGCFESHRAVLARIAGGPHRAGLILEDDADFRAGLGPGLAALSGERWDVVWGVHSAAGGVVNGGAGLMECPPGQPLLTTHFVGVTQPVAALLVPYLDAVAAREMGDPEGGPMHVDGAYNWFRAAHPALRTLAPRDAWARQRPSRTDIHAVGSLDRVEALRPAMDLVRRLKRRWGGHRR